MIGIAISHMMVPGEMKLVNRVCLYQLHERV
jgi:hypothetical protein